MSTTAPTPPLKAPFPYFGGKRTVSTLVWERLGDPDNYIEPFCGSAAVLLSRATTPRIETVNDADCYLSNFWRATAAAPETVAEHADWPVNEADLHARHRWLVLSDEARAFRAAMRSDPTHYDARIAGWWCWGLCCWIGGGWCVSPEECQRNEGATPALMGSDGKGQGVVNTRRPVLSRAGSNGGVASIEDEVPGEKLPNISGQANKHGRRKHLGRGVNAEVEAQVEVPEAADLHQKRPVVGIPNGQGQGSSGRGVHADPGTGGPPLKQCLPSIAGDSGASGRGVNASAMGGFNPTEWAQKPQLANWNDQHLNAASPGSRVNDSARPQLADAHARGRGVHANDSATACNQRRAWLLDWFGRLRDRLRTVRVCCGHWDRVCSSPSVTTRLGLTGIFLDPPYAHDVERMRRWLIHLEGGGAAPDPGTGATNRDAGLYSNDRTQDVDRLVAEVHRFCLERGADPKIRIALCGYQGEHDALVAHGWTEVPWKAQGGYGNRSDEGKANAARERIWFSPHCLTPGSSPGPLFD